MTEEENAQENQEDRAEQQSKTTASEREKLQQGTQPEPEPNVTVEGEVFEADEITEDEDEDEEENEEHIVKEEDDVDDEELAENEKLSAAVLEALFNKNTSSFRCLAQMLLSRSSLLRHPLYHFPPLEDPGIDAAFYYVEPEEPIDNVCIERYKQVCKEFNIVPLSRVIKSLPTKELNLRYYSLTTKEVKAVAIALKVNTFVEELNLEKNFLYPDSAYYIEDLLRENNTLKVLNMKKCRIGSEVNIPFLGIGYACSGCPSRFCDDDPAIIYGYCCGCASIFDILPVKCPPVIECPLNGYELCDRYEYMMRCCCAH